MDTIFPGLCLTRQRAKKSVCTLTSNAYGIVSRTDAIKALRHSCLLPAHLEESAQVLRSTPKPGKRFDIEIYQ